jgi:enediyne biosynthesis protein E4
VPEKYRGRMRTLSVLFLISAVSAQAQPGITTQPKSQSVSPGANVTFRVTANGDAPLAYQWNFNTGPLANATNSTLILTNISTTNSGNYFVTISNASGSTNSAVAVLDIDPTFTKVTSGAIAMDGGDSSGCAWGDFDGDGFPDLFVGNGGTKNFLYRNNGDGTFSKLATSVPSRDSGYGGSWADFDNDGLLDLFVSNLGSNYLYRNNGDGTFTKVTPFAGSSGSNSWSGSWGDYDRDGWIDLFISNGAGNNNALLHNNGDGTFTRVTLQRIVRDGGATIGAAWQDYDNDGWPDLYAANNGGVSFLYHNLHDGTFERVSSQRIATDSQNAIVPDWGDYDNDGWPDLGVGVFGRNMIYRNLSDGTFARQTNGPAVLDSQNSEIVQWIDYDNDGYLDLFSANAGGQNNTLYHNSEEGTFTKVTTGSIVNDGGNSAGCAWADYDNDGYLDLFVANWQGSRPNFLYRNNGNTNHWLKVNCIGGASNRNGIGAKVRAYATIGGKAFWQLREISGGTGFGQTTPLAHFGLGDAPKVEKLRIEWPSGIVQELSNVEVNQVLNVVEPPRFEAVKTNPGNFEFAILSPAQSKYVIEASSDLQVWTNLTTWTNTTRKNVFHEELLSPVLQRFFRIKR